jgi:hypothetical protein
MNEILHPRSRSKIQKIEYPFVLLENGRVMKLTPQQSKRRYNPSFSFRPEFDINASVPDQVPASENRLSTVPQERQNDPKQQFGEQKPWPDDGGIVI